MNPTNEPTTRLVSLTIRDPKEYYTGERGKQYCVAAKIVINGQTCTVEELPIPDEFSKQICNLVERAAHKQISDALAAAVQAFENRIALEAGIEHQQLEDLSQHDENEGNLPDIAQPEMDVTIIKD